MLVRSAVFAAILACTAPAYAQPHEPAPELPALAVNGQMQDAQIAAAVGAWFADLQQQGAFNGSVLVARGGSHL
jgi:hypothetical protein